MSYYESAEGEMISKARTEREVLKHGASFTEMLQDLGDHTEYDAQEVLRWLGY